MFEYYLELSIGCRRVYRLFGIQECRKHPFGDSRLFTLMQYISDTRRHSDNSSTRDGFCFSDVYATAFLYRYRPLHSELVCIEVDVAPLESAYLTAPKSCQCFYIEEVAPIVFFLDFFKEGFELFITENLFLGIVGFRYRCTVCRVLC